MVKTKTKNKENQIRKTKKTKMKKQNIKQIIPPSPALIKQLNEMGYILSNDNVIIKVRTKESNEVQK
jgi:hypothetical protein